MSKSKIIEALFAIGAVKFGSFTLKSGITSPFYIDLRLLVSHPKLLKEISDALWKKIEDHTFNLLCGVPYTALPIASYLSVAHNVPMLLKRKEAKSYGTKQLVEGVWKEGDTCMIIEDIITSGKSIFETIDPLENLGINVRDIAVLINREQGGQAVVEKKGYTLHPLLTITEILHHLKTKKLVDPSIVFETEKFIRENQTR